MGYYMAEYTPQFLKSMEFVMKWEGGDKYTNDPDDPGGETKYGICKAAFPNEDIKNLTEDRANYLYYTHFWLKCCCNMMPMIVALPVFDMAVNNGPKNSILALQRALCDCGFPILDDGLIGSTTLGAIHAIPDKKDLAEECLQNREEHYDNCVKRRPKSAKYRKGWQNRVNDLRKVLSL